ncbi:MAG: TetR/AcrR family transcriptional regulator [Candidatus Didemnitutus sp.]|nr:TetR/AcrR family transcriptional regulator [Candidatus Didemnitutus sp.]
MASRLSESPAVPAAAEARARIVRAARAHLFAHGYSSWTMDDLATELGMSKKTLYQHFPGKEELVRAALEQFASEVRAEADAIIADRNLTFAEKLRGFTGGMHQRLSLLTPHVMRDLQRFAPKLHDLTFELRRRNLPSIFGRLLEQGQLTGKVRPELDAPFAAEFLLHAIQGIMQPATLEHLNLAPHQAFEKAMNLYFGGLLTPAGRKDYEKSFPR